MPAHWPRRCWACLGRDADPALPAFEAVPTLRHVPVVARAAWAQCLARTVSAAATLNTTTAVRQEARDCFWPLQVGVGTPETEAAIHATRQWASHHASSLDRVLVWVDFRNAFNSVSRQAFLARTREHLPAVACWANYCYSQTSHLRFGDRVVLVGSSKAIRLVPCCSHSRCNLPFVRLPLTPSTCALATSTMRSSRGPLHMLLARCGTSLLRRGTRACSSSRVSLCLPLAQPRALTCCCCHPACPWLPPTPSSSWVPRLVQMVSASAIARKLSRRLPLALMLWPTCLTRRLRSCSSDTAPKLMHSMRVTPRAAHASALDSFDERVRGCLERLGGLPLTASAWLQASLGTPFARHAPAAFLASVSSTLPKQELDRQYSLTSAVLSLTSRCLLRTSELSVSFLPLLSSLLASASGESARAHLRLLQQPGAGAWLHARPCEALGLHIDPAFFRVLLLHLRLPVASSDGFCPLCDGIADRFGDHARTCPCGGDRCKRQQCARCQSGLSPEGLRSLGCSLPGLRPLGLVKPETGGPPAGGRRKGMCRPGTCMGPACDLAVTGLRASVRAASAADGSSAITAYEERKRNRARNAVLAGVSRP